MDILNTILLSTLGKTEIFTLFVVCIIIFFQIRLFLKNKARMKEFSEIFDDIDSFRYETDEYGNVQKIIGSGNDTYLEIENSINGYLSNNKGSIINFDLLKDAVDRHCDSLEEDITVQTPIPLYLGLIGTMLGVILGLIPAINGGFNDNPTSLLIGVAIAMTASATGILLTTINSMSFKKSKLAKERGENSFIVWMQANLLPILSEDASQAFDRMVANLNLFNQNFAENSKELKSTLKEVNASYEIQADIIDTIQQIDMLKMAKANVFVLKELKDCTDSLEKFNRYIVKLNEFTEQVQEYIAQFSKFEVLENIANFFKDEIHAIEQRKGEIAKQVGDLDEYLKKSFEQIGNTANKNSEELEFALRKQCDRFNELAAEQERTFLESAQRMQTMFDEQIKQLPIVAKALQNLPKEFDKLSERIESSNNRLASTLEKLEKSNNPQQTIQKTKQNWIVTVAAILLIIWMLPKIINMIKSYFTEWF